MAERGPSKPPTTGDLFEHYGVPERPVHEAELPPSVPARPCSGCSWLRPLPHAGPCEMCGTSPPPSS